MLKDEELEKLLTLEQPFAFFRTKLAHDNLRWLNISQLMPNLRAVHLNVFECRNCGISWWWSAENTVRAVPCLRKLLQIVAHSTGLPLWRITYLQQVFGPTEQLISSP